MKRISSLITFFSLIIGLRLLKHRLLCEMIMLSSKQSNILIRLANKPRKIMPIRKLSNFSLRHLIWTRNYLDQKLAKPRRIDGSAGPAGIAGSAWLIMDLV